MVGGLGTNIGSVDENEGGSKARYRGVNFREARFFQPENREDPRNSLLDMFGETLNLSEEEEAERRRKARGRSTGANTGGSSWFGFGK
jgi:hypothetical protein